MDHYPVALTELERISLEYVQHHTAEVFDRIDREDTGFVITNTEGKDHMLLCPASWYDWLTEEDMGTATMLVAKRNYIEEMAPKHTIELALQYSFQLSLEELQKAMKFFTEQIEKRTNHPYQNEWLRFLVRLRLRLQARQRIFDSQYAIVGVLPAEDYHVYCFCRDGKTRLLDMKPWIERGGVFEHLRDENFFRDRMCVIGDTLAWDESGDKDPYVCIDMDPEMLYYRGVIEDPPAGIFLPGLRDIPCKIITTSLDEELSPGKVPN